jgi:cell volume regulation protein A
VASVALAALSFGVADVIGGSGFLAVYLVGLAVGRAPSPYRRQIVSFHEGLAFLAQIALFVVLGLLVFPSQLASVVAPGLVLATVLVIVVRPVAVAIATALNPFSLRERALLGWAGLRGAAPIVLATFPLSARVRDAETIFNAVFFVVVVSTLIQGTTLERLARLLGLVDASGAGRAAPLEADPLGSLELLEFEVRADQSVVGSSVSALGLPTEALVAVITRDAETFPPRGTTVLQSGDRLAVLAPRAKHADVERVFARWRTPV